MTRLKLYAAWIAAALVVSAGWWAVAVYGFDEFDRGYGRDTWFLLQLYVSALFVLAGGCGFVLITLYRRSTVSSGLLAGAGFAIGQQFFVFVLERVRPDRDALFQELTVALMIGIASGLVAPRRVAVR